MCVRFLQDRVGLLKVALLVIVSFQCTFLTAQNLVPNPSFEEYEKLECNLNAPINPPFENPKIWFQSILKDWILPTKIPAQVYSTRLSNDCLANPTHLFNKGYPKDGFNMIEIELLGLYLLHFDTRAYIEVKLKEKLMAREVYVVGGYYSLANMTASGSGGGTLTFTLSGACQNISVAKSVWVGAPDTPVVMVWPGITMGEMTCNSPYIHQVYHPSTVSGSTIQWYAGDSWHIIGASTGDHANIRANGSGYANVTFTNTCGSASFFGPDYDPCMEFLMAYPNPATGVLNVSLTSSEANSKEMINPTLSS